MNLKDKYKLVVDGNKGCEECCFAGKLNGCILSVNSEELTDQVGNCCPNGHYELIEARSNKRSVSIETLEELKNSIGMVGFKCKDEKLGRAINIINDLLMKED